MPAAEFSTADVFLSMLYFFLFVIWIWLVFALLSDIIRSPDLTGWGRAAWALSLILLPLLGAVAYLVVRGGTMSERMVAQEHRRDRAFQSYTLGIPPSAAPDVDAR
jgi:Phospholipase_D-nuclease N-terminal